MNTVLNYSPPVVQKSVKKDTALNKCHISFIYYYNLFAGKEELKEGF